MRNRLFKIALGSVLAFALAGCEILKQSGVVQEPTVNYESFSIKRISADGIELAPRFAINNPNAFPIPVDSIDYGIRLNQQTLTSGRTDKVGEIPATDSKSTDVLVKLTGESVNALKEVLFNDGRVTIDLSGKTKVMGFAIPFAKTLTLAKPKLSIADMNVKKASFNEVAMDIVLAIDNPNDFSLPLNNVGYRIKSQGKSLFSGNTGNQSLEKGSNKISVPIRIKPSDLFSSVFSMMGQGSVPITIETDSALFNYSVKKDIDMAKLLR